MMEPDDRSIRSASNPRFRRALALVQRARDRREQRASVIEGAHLLDAYMRRFGPPAEVFIADAAACSAELERLLAALEARPWRLAPSLFRQLSQVQNGIGPIAIVDTPDPGLPPTIDQDVVYLDRIQDPGNVGSILRTCAAVGVSRVITAPGTAFCWSPKVLRAGQGAHFHLDIHEGVDWPELLGRCRMRLLCASADGAGRIDRADLRGASLWVFGNEGEGVAAGIRGHADVHALAIAQTPGVESLNVGVAAAVCLYEQWRQRGYPGAVATGRA